jgi:hypothetical protein
MPRCIGGFQRGTLCMTVPLLPRTRALWRSLVASVSDRYQPELHYMRGPGPRFRELEARRGLMTEQQPARGKGEAHKYCPKCATLMVLERVKPTFGPLTESRVYKCLRCGSVVDETIQAGLPHP